MNGKKHTLTHTHLLNEEDPLLELQFVVEEGQPGHQNVLGSHGQACDDVDEWLEHIRVVFCGCVCMCMYEYVFVWVSKYEISACMYVCSHKQSLFSNSLT
jgi:hypothetical protein